MTSGFESIAEIAVEIIPIAYASYKEYRSRKRMEKNNGQGNIALGEVFWKRIVIGEKQYFVIISNDGGNPKVLVIGEDGIQREILTKIEAGKEDGE